MNPIAPGSETVADGPRFGNAPLFLGNSGMIDAQMSASPPPVDAPVAPEANSERLRATIARLQADGHLSEADAERMQTALPETLKESTYIIRHLTAHWAIGAVFAFDLVPLPLGTIGRVGWVLGNRVIETCLGRWERASVHSLAVLATSAIPVAGYFAYLIPLRSRSADAAFLYANHFTYTRSNCALPTYLERRPKWMAWIVRKMVGVPGGQTPPDVQEQEIGN